MNDPRSGCPINLTLVEAPQTATDATDGLAFVLTGAKAWLEHGIELNFVADRFPDGLPSGCVWSKVRFRAIEIVG